MPPPKSIAKVLQDSPLLSTKDVAKLFPSKEAKKQLGELARALEEAKKHNVSAGKTWQTLTTYKAVAIRILKKAVGVSI